MTPRASDARQRERHRMFCFLGLTLNGGLARAIKTIKTHQLTHLHIKTSASWNASRSRFLDGRERERERETNHLDPFSIHVHPFQWSIPWLTKLTRVGFFTTPILVGGPTQATAATWRCNGCCRGVAMLLSGRIWKNGKVNTDKNCSNMFKQNW